MKRFAPRSTACLLVAVAALSAACSNTDPLAPRAASTLRASNTAGPVRAGGYMVAWGRDSSATGGASANGGYMVAWGKDGDGGTAGAQATGGYMVAWGKDGGEP